MALLVRPLVLSLTRMIRRAGTGPAGAISPRRREGLLDLVREAIADLFGARPDLVIAGEGQPRAPIARLIAAGTRTATLLVITPALAEVRRRLAHHPDLLDALTGGRVLPPGGTPQRPLFDPARTWVDPNGYTLSERIWQNGHDVRTQLDTLLDYHIGRGTSAVDVAKELDQYLTIEGRQSTTRRPYGTKGLHAPRRLLRTEVSRAHGAATIEAARLNPFTTGVKWNLSGSHSREDECDRKASVDEHGLGRGVYPPDQVPAHPSHPHCKCFLTPHTARNVKQVIDDLGRWAAGEAAPGFEETGTVPLESEYLLTWLTGFPPPQRSA